MPTDKSRLPRDPEVLLDMVVDLTRQLDQTNHRLDKTNRLLAQLLSARSGTRSEQLSADQLGLLRRNSALQRLKRVNRRRTKAVTATIRRRAQASPIRESRAEGSRCRVT